MLADAASVGAQQMVTHTRGASPVLVESAEVRTEITGRIAVTTFDLVFRNPNARVLEGTFEFPLLAGQSVVRFALDVGGHLREAVPVEKNRGRLVFEEIERRGVDPGLLEQTAGNNYRARVYPIPAFGTRRVLIAYQEDVAAVHRRYRLALDFPQPLKTFRLVVTAQTGATKRPAVHTTLPLDLPAWRDAQVLDVTRTGFLARGVLELELPAASAPAVLTQRRGAGEFFYAEVPLPAMKAIGRPPPHVLGLLWDASGSGRERDHAREWALLDAWFARVPDVTVRVVPFRDQPEKPVEFRVVGGDWKQLREYLEHLVYDGATSFDGVADLPGIDEWLLFSDGLINYGAQRRPQLALRPPVHAVFASVRGDAARLRGLAEGHDGEFVDLMRGSAIVAAGQLRSRSPRVLAINRDPESAAEVFPERGARLAGDSLVVTGRLKGASTHLELRVGHTAADAVTVPVEIRSGEGASEFAARAWAIAKIASLESHADDNRDDIRRTSQEFGVVTAGTSLIVLETLMDYLRYDIAPPEELRAEWEAHRHATADARRKDENRHLDTVVREFELRRAWWEKSFPKDQPTEAETKPAGDFESFQGAGARREAAEAQTWSQSSDVIQLSPFQVNSGGVTYGSGSSRSASARGLALSASGVVSPAMRASIIGGEPGAPGAGPTSIVLKPWQPNAGYLDRLRRAPAEERYTIYLEERSAHERQPGFFLDVAAFFFGEQEPALGLRILSNLAELQLDDAALLRVLGQRLLEVGRAELARPLFERVLVLRPEEPQSRRDLALACAAVKDYQHAIDLLWEVVSRTWDARFPQIEQIALGEMNAIIATCGRKLDVSHIDGRLRENLPVGLRAVLTWDADACDIDLWVDDPNGERAIYNHPRTYQGGRMSRDFTGGYGPEEFLLRDPKPGKYVVRINYFAERRQTALGPVTATVRLITGFGTPSQKEERLTVRLSESKESLEIGTIEIPKL